MTNPPSSPQLVQDNRTGCPKPGDSYSTERAGKKSVKRLHPIRVKKRLEKRRSVLFSERSRDQPRNREIRSMRWIRRFSGGCGLRETSSEIRSGNGNQEAKEVPYSRLSHPDGIENIIRLWFQ
jgi:hypothetical protein